MGPFEFFLPPVFDRLPGLLPDLLAIGVIGGKQAARTGLAALRAAGAAKEANGAGPLLAGLGLTLTQLAFDLDPCNAVLARGVAGMAAAHGVSLAAADARVVAVAGQGAVPPAWGEACARAKRTGEWEELCRDAAGWTAGETGPARSVVARILGLAALAAGDATRLAAWRDGLEAADTPGLAWMSTQAALRLDGREAGIRALRAFLARWPWCVEALLALYDLQTGRDAALTALPGELAILLYSFNKADDLGRTLESLLASRLPSFRIFALDNGSTDATSDVLAAFAARLGGERFTALRAPVNVGAPAGRNWLKHLPAVARADFVAYCDDDITLPPDWALRLGAAVAAYPEAGVYGCRIHDAGRPAVVQAAAFHLEPTGPGEPLAATDLQLQAPDVGQFACCRPTLSVTGCCHLFPGAALAAGGDFDIRFSPSQFDDFDRDLRAALAGQWAVCQGHLGIGHKRASGGTARRERAAGANAHGNLLKLQGKYDAGEHRRLLREQRVRLLTDIRKKAIWLSRHDEREEMEP